MTDLEAQPVLPARIVATASWLPGEAVSTASLAALAMPDRLAADVETRTGTRTRHFASAQETFASQAVVAVLVVAVGPNVQRLKVGDAVMGDLSAKMAWGAPRPPARHHRLGTIAVLDNGVPRKYACPSRPAAARSPRQLLPWNADLRNAVHQALIPAINKHYRRDAELQGVQGPVQGAAISVAQRMSSNLQLNLHWHVLLADGVWTEQDG